MNFLRVVSSAVVNTSYQYIDGTVHTDHSLSAASRSRDAVSLEKYSKPEQKHYCGCDARRLSWSSTPVALRCRARNVSITIIRIKNHITITQSSRDITIVIAHQCFMDGCVYTFRNAETVVRLYSNRAATIINSSRQ